jgi:hypothetical protein
MSLPILVALVTVGIALAVLSVHLTGGSKRSSIADADHAARLLLADFPNERPGPALLTVDGQSAFMDLPGGRTGIVQSFGDGYFTRIVTAGDVASVRVQDPAVITIRFRDFTWTGGHFRFGERAVAEALAMSLGMNSKSGA